MGEVAKRSDGGPARKAPGKKAPAKKAAKKAPAKKAGAKKAAKKAGPKKAAPGTHGPDTPRTGRPSMGVPELPAPPTDPLTVLGLTAPFTVTQLRRAWRSYASRHHPDQGGDAATFARGRSAYEALSARLDDRR
jgi:hypothetical protein